MCCPRCGGALAKWGYARERTVRALGAATVNVRPRRVRCRDCATTHILLPTALQPRCADTTEVIGTALAHKANGLGFRRIAAASAGRIDGGRWLRRATAKHLASRAYQQGAPGLIQLAPDVFTEIHYARQPVAAHADRAHRQRLSGSPPLRVRDPQWTLIGMYTRGRLLAHPAAAENRVHRDTPCSRQASPHRRTDRHRADDAVTATITPSRWRPTPPFRLHRK